MDAQRWRQIEEIYHSARNQAPEGRVAFVSEACRGEADLLAFQHEIQLDPLSSIAYTNVAFSHHIMGNFLAAERSAAEIVKRRSTSRASSNSSTTWACAVNVSRCRLCQAARQ
jgi:hypothetical protein